MMFSLFLILSSSRLSCKTYNNKNVDWFAAIKVPKIKDRISTHESGLGYFYRDASSKFIEGPGDLNQNSDNPLYYTLSPMYSGVSDIGYILVSDQPPNGKSVSATRAHQKGVMIFDKDNGIYLEHSVPRFPPDPATTKTYSFPDSGVTYGQSFLCLTLEHSDLDQVLKTYLVNFPYVYSQNIPSYASSKMPTITKLLNQEWNKKDMTIVSDVKAGRTEFKLYGKHRKWGLDLYHDLLAPSIKADIFAESWPNGVGTMNSDCSGSYRAYNVLHLSFSSIDWKRTKDHSKWGVASTTVCIGGINRQESQKTRGGGAFCVKDTSLSLEMKGFIDQYEKC